MSWLNKSIEEYKYDENGNLLERQLSRWNQESVSWVPYRKYERKMESDRKAGYSIDYWDFHTEDWRAYKRASYRYSDKGKVDHILFETWIDNKWENHSIRKNSHNTEDELSFMEVDLFDNESMGWNKSSHVDYELTEFGKLSASISKKWKSENSDWENLQRFTYYYSEKGAMLSAWTDTSKEMELFPNPAVDNLNIRSLPTGTITILDALGKIIMQTENSENEIQLDVSKWEMGVYSVQVNGEEVQKFVKH
ncbi:MAG: T9SS type A sorting domain-containing protein [Crocinitomicaceae bacterium]|nr:T9SS type A sorting domain-containing protein [Crocinitomicaceae bacterium]